MKNIRSTWLFSVLLLSLSFMTNLVHAEDPYPNKPIKIIVGITPGASTDFLAREIGRGLSERLKVPVIVENKPGANTIIANNLVAKSPPDGYTIYLTNIVSAINPWMYTNMPYDFKKDMKNIVLVGVSDNLFAVNSKLGINTAQEMVAFAKKNPGQFSYGSSGVGSIHHLIMELIAEKAQVQLNHIPYRGRLPLSLTCWAAIFMAIVERFLHNKSSLKEETLSLYLSHRQSVQYTCLMSQHWPKQACLLLLQGIGWVYPPLREHLTRLLISLIKK